MHTINTSSSPTSRSIKIYYNCLIYKNLFLFTTLNTKSISHVVQFNVLLYTQGFLYKVVLSWFKNHHRCINPHNLVQEKCLASLIGCEQLIFCLYRKSCIKLINNVINIIFYLYINYGTFYIYF